ncbi:MAG TPA: GTPase [Gemmataceae bacterium]|nr:GTPase [Gemmataceae bacterium]
MNASEPADETFVSRLTPVGNAAIATLGLCGPAAYVAIRTLFHPSGQQSGQLPEFPDRGRIWFGRLGEKTADEVVVSIQSNQPAPWVEVHCHGGNEVVRMLLDLFAAHGIRECPWQHFQRITLGDPYQALAARALADALTARTAAILLDQYQGALIRRLDEIRAAWARGDAEKAGRLLGEMAAHAELGRHLTTPWRVVVAGAPNVGKSSLVNALAGYQRCVVAPSPGTTRDVVRTILAVDGWPIELADTAGLRDEALPLELHGIDLARAAARTADVCLWLVDGSTEPVWPDHAVKAGKLIVNKIDLPPAWDFSRASDAVCVSALTGEGMGDLCQALSRWLVPEPPAPGAGVPFTTELCDAVDLAWRLYRSGQMADSLRALESMM